MAKTLSRSAMLALAVACALACELQGQTIPRQRMVTPESTIRIDLSTPAAALDSYFRARRATDIVAINKTLATTEPRKQLYVDVAVNFLMWRHYLERQAVQKFGKEAAIKVEGHARSLDDQFALDARRLTEATVELAKAQGDTPETAKLFLKVEPGRPEGLQTDRFEFLDIYWLIKTPDGWKVDFLKTYDCLGDDKEPLLKFEAGIFPIMANAFRDLTTKLQQGAFPSANALKSALQEQWNKTYGDPPAAAAAEPPAPPDAQVDHATPAPPAPKPRANRPPPPPPPP
jgi:hypothetical protein